MSGIPQPTRSPTSLRPVADANATDEDSTFPTDSPGDEGKTRMEIDYIDEELEESIPASDPPASIPTTGIGAPGHRPPKVGADQPLTFGLGI